MINHTVDNAFIAFAREIASQRLSAEEWAAIESPDQFQTPGYCGGFDATEMAFCFSFYNPQGKEYWFQLSLEQVYSVAKGICKHSN